MNSPWQHIAAPPRSIPPMLAAQMYLGGAMTQIGWLFFGFGSIFFWLFAWHADLSGWRFREGAIARIPGQVLDCTNTKYWIGGDDTSRGTPVYENRYRYEVNGELLTGKSYDTGSCRAGARVTVEHLTGRPEFSRIEGMRRDVMSAWAILVALFPGAGLVLAIVGLRRGRLRVRLLRDGLPATGGVTARVPTRSSTMGRPDYRVTVEFTAPDGSRRSTTVRTNHPEALESAAGATVLYDPGNPDRAVPMGGLPGAVSEDGSGSFVGGASRAFLLLPALSVLCNGWFLWRCWNGR